MRILVTSFGIPSNKFSKFSFTRNILNQKDTKLSKIKKNIEYTYKT